VLTPTLAAEAAMLEIPISADTSNVAHGKDAKRIERPPDPNRQTLRRERNTGNAEREKFTDP
jgi:hypothetical protein